MAYTGTSFKDLNESFETFISHVQHGTFGLVVFCILLYIVTGKEMLVHFQYACGVVLFVAFIAQKGYQAIVALIDERLPPKPFKADESAG